MENYKAQLLLGLHFWVLKLQLLKFRITDFSGQLLSFNSYYLSPKVKLKIPSLTKCGELKGATFVRLTFLRFEVATSEIANYWFFRSIIIFQLIIWVFANSFRTSSSSNYYQHRWFHTVILISSCEHFVEQVILNIKFQTQPQNSISQFPQLFTTSNTHFLVKNLMAVNLLVFDFQDLQLQLLKMQITDFSGQLLSFNS